MLGSEHQSFHEAINSNSLELSEKYHEMLKIQFHKMIDGSKPLDYK